MEEVLDQGEFDYQISKDDPNVFKWQDKAVFCSPKFSWERHLNC